MGYFEDVTGTSKETRDIYRQNKTATGGQRITQQTINEAAKQGVPLSSKENPNAARDSGRVMAKPAPKQAPIPAVRTAMAAVKPVKGGPITAQAVGNMSEADYLQMIMDAGMPPGPRPRPAFGGNDPTAAINGTAPIPAARPSWMDNEAETDKAMADAQSRGISLEAMMSGAAGGAAMYGAMKLVRQMYEAQKKGKFTDIPLKPQPGAKPPPGVTPKSDNLYDGFLVTPGKQLAVQGRNMSVVPRNSMIIDGVANEVSPWPTIKGPEGTVDRAKRTGLERLIPGGGEINAPREVQSEPYKAKPTNGYQPQKQLGDADSPNYRDMMIPGGAMEEAVRIKKMMDEYGLKSPSEMGITPSNRPAVYRALQSLM